jgi:hypothetical protein
VNIGDGIANLWQDLIRLLEAVVLPDWGALIGLIPLLLAPLIGLYVFAMFAGWSVFAISHPRAKLRMVEGPHVLELDAVGGPVIPSGEPFSLHEGLVFPPGTVRSDRGELLVVRCPKCGLDRAADQPACGQCGLKLNYRLGIRSARPPGPPPGGAAAA